MMAIGGFVPGETTQRRPGQAEAQQGIQASLKVGGGTYQSSEAGKCTYAPVASIYQTMAELWSVQQSQDGRSLTLSFWKPKDGSADMITLSVRNGNASHQVNTVKGAPAAGSGTVRFEKAGNGGTFTVDAKSKEGAAISGTIRCEAFGRHAAEGGL
jgi:hypothetical protein